jgi:hypothetical protein
MVLCKLQLCTYMLHNTAIDNLTTYFHGYTNLNVLQEFSSELSYKLSGCLHIADALPHYIPIFLHISDECRISDQ